MRERSGKRERRRSASQEALPSFCLSLRGEARLIRSSQMSRQTLPKTSYCGRRWPSSRHWGGSKPIPSPLLALCTAKQPRPACVDRPHVLGLCANSGHPNLVALGEGKKDRLNEKDGHWPDICGDL